MANQWFKFFGGEYLSDPKIERLSPIERSCWVTLLCLASMNGDGIVEFLTVEVLLNKSGIQFDPYHPEEWEKALGVLVKFQNLKMIDLGDDGVITVTNWKKRQETSMTGAERVAKYRERLKQSISNENVTENVTNVTLEENRIEENRIEEKRNDNTRDKPESSLSWLGTFNEKEEFTCGVPQETLEAFSKKYRCSEDQIKNKCEDLVLWAKTSRKVKKNYKTFLQVILKRNFGLRTEEDKVLQERIDRTKESMAFTGSSSFAKSLAAKMKM